MTLLQKIMQAFPELEGQYNLFTGNPILLQNDGDDKGDYIKIWNYEKPLTKELKEFYRP
jgi:hypothetical protein